VDVVDAGVALAVGGEIALDDFEAREDRGHGRVALRPVVLGVL
jgi:hypothetical protein